MSFDGIQQNLWDANALDGLGNSDTLGGDIDTAISINNIFIEANYLRLDTSNDPLTGTLTMNGTLSTNGYAYFGNDVIVSVNVVAQGLDAMSVYGDYGEFGVDLSSLGLMVYNQLSVYNVATFGTKISVHDAVISNRISASHYYGISPFTGDLNGHLSVSGNSFFHGTLSIQNDTYFKGSNYFTTLANFDTSDLTISGKQTKFNVSNLPYRSGDTVGGKQYSGQELLMLDNSAFFAGTVIRISVSEILKNYTGVISVNNNLTITGTTSVGGALTLGTLPIGGINDLNYYDEGPTGGTTNTWTSASFSAQPAGDWVIWWSFSHKSTVTTTSGAGHVLEYYDNTGTWIAVITDYTNISTANVEFSNSRNRVVNIPSTFTQLRVRVGTLCVSGTQTLIFTDVIMARKFF